MDRPAGTHRQQGSRSLSRGRAVLGVRDLTTTYGGIVALRGATLNVPRGRIVALIGANGAGKTTLLNTICGVVHAAGGEVRFDGAALLGEPTHRVARRGVLMVPEGRQILGPLSVRENLELGRLAAARRPQDATTDLEKVFALFPRLRERADGQAGLLSGGEQQMLAIGRALMGAPKVLCSTSPASASHPRWSRKCSRHCVCSTRRVSRFFWWNRRRVARWSSRTMGMSWSAGRSCSAAQPQICSASRGLWSIISAGRCTEKVCERCEI